MRLRHVLAMAATLIASPFAPAGAQETGSLIPRGSPAQIRGTAPADVRRTFMEFGACVIRRSPSRADRLTRMAITDPQFRPQMERLANDECLSTGLMRMHVTHLRGALFEAIYARNYSALGRVDFNALASPDYGAGYSDPLPQEVINVIALARFGECVARRDGINAVHLLNSGPGTSMEDTLVRNLTPSFSGCIPQGETIRLSRMIVRFAIAEGVVRMLRDDPAGGN